MTLLPRTVTTLAAITASAAVRGIHTHCRDIAALGLVTSIWRDPMLHFLSTTIIAPTRDALRRWFTDHVAPDTLLTGHSITPMIDALHGVGIAAAAIPLWCDVAKLHGPVLPIEVMAPLHHAVAVDPTAICLNGPLNAPSRQAELEFAVTTNAVASWIIWMSAFLPGHEHAPARKQMREVLSLRLRQQDTAPPTFCPVN